MTKGATAIFRPTSASQEALREARKRLVVRKGAEAAAGRHTSTGPTLTLPSGR